MNFSPTDYQMSSAIDLKTIQAKSVIFIYLEDSQSDKCQQNQSGKYHDHVPDIPADHKGSQLQSTIGLFL